MTAPRRLVIHLRDDARPVYSIPDWAVDEIREALPDGWEVVVPDAPADGRGDGGDDLPPAVLDAVRDAEVYLGYGVPAAVLHAAPGLKWAHTASAGVGGSLRDEIAHSDVVLTNAAGVYAEPMADTVLAMMLHFARGLDFAVRAQADRRWDKAPFDDAESPIRELNEATVGIVGLGGIGRAVAHRASALGMTVVASRRGGGDGPDGVEVFHGEDALDQLLPRADFLVVTVPLTAETEGLIGARELAMLPEGAVVINVARGAVLDERALIDALRSGRLRGAGLDVFAREPLPDDSPLWTLPNVLVTPHVSGASHRFWRRQTELIVQNIRRYAAGGPLRNTVDKKAGY
ncbi:D-2-hydroxyacid dehydrogenase [Longimicrobium terrae]|uniref:Phosphoglycerate dehydrogenase-like enzyme n=1 Tax=Longimicrobium terrae TaxID=1639882 RepID=A0A841H741_9BACT|nr:D-2-hydroxyacid dehydrogenase [Longimicrobium terrae]MBB4638232.1 phosphoglycerate dehydrogenase-like enzyme [Longimicrobium terrae]MBB6073798.1 phosphoglycerate dehydrogenase-like enzyme [Longimicrobium terrae]NNC30290.1 D-2-hydroxyacid dehydrogenase [Longimicrobium terrae]